MTTDLQRPQMLLLIMALIGNAVGHALFLMTFPALGRTMGLTDVQAGLVIGVSALLLTVAAPFWGWFSERQGRRPVVIVAMLASSLGLAASALVIHSAQAGWITALLAFVLMLAVRLVYALLSGGLKPAAQAIMADVSDAHSRARAMGLMGAAFGVGTLLGGGLAMAFGGGRLLSVFFIVSAVLMVNGVLQWWRLSETYPVGTVQPDQVVRFRLAPYWPYLLFTLLGLTVYSLLQQVTVLRLQDDFGLAVGVSIQRTGGIMMTATLAMIITQGLIVRGLNWQPLRLIQAGAGLATCALGVAALAPNVAVLWLSMMVLGAGIGLLLPGNLAGMSLLAGPHRQGRVAGINSVAMGLGMALGPVLGALAHQWHVAGAYWLAAALCLLVLLIAWGVVPERSSISAEGALL